MISGPPTRIAVSAMRAYYSKLMPSRLLRVGGNHSSPGPWRTIQIVGGAHPPTTGASHPAAPGGHSAATFNLIYRPILFIGYILPRFY